jgi:hypothetical protein
MRLTKAQKFLKRIHGTPDEITDEIIEAIGTKDVTAPEALKAIRAYRERWAIAGKTSSRKPKAEPTPP